MRDFLANNSNFEETVRGDNQVFEQFLQTPEEREEANQTTFSDIVFSPAGIALGAADTLLQSIGLVDENDVGNALRGISSAAGQIYNRNQDGYRLLGDIGTAFTGAGLATKLLRAPSLARTLATAGRTSKTARLAEKLIVSDQGRVDNYVNLLTKKAVALGQAGIRNPINVESFRQLNNATRLKQFTNDLKEGVAAEAFIATFQSESELFFPEGQSFSDVTIGAIGGLGIGNVIGQAIVTPAIKKAARAGGIAASKRGVEYSTNPSTNFIIADGVEQEFREGKFADNINALTNQDGTVKSEIDNQITEAQRQKNNSVVTLQQAEPIKGLSTVMLGDANKSIVKSLETITQSDPRLGANIVSIEPVEFLYEFNGAKGQNILKELKLEQADLNKQRLSAAAGIEENLIDSKLENVNRQIADLSGDIVPLKVNQLGLVTSDINSRTVFDEKRISTSTIPREINNNNIGKTIHLTRVDGGDNALQAGVDVSGKMFVRKGKKLEQISSSAGLGDYNGSKIYAAHNRALNDLGKILRGDEGVVQPRAATKITKADSFETLDYVQQALKLYGNNGDFKSIAKVIDLSDFEDINDIKFHTINKKFDRFKNIFRNYENNLRNGNATNTPVEDFSTQLMLPAGDANGTSNYVTEFFLDVIKEGKTVGKDYNELMNNFTQHFAADASERTVQGVRINNGLNAGNLLEFDYIGAIKSNNESFALALRRNSDEDELIPARALSDVARLTEEQRQLDLGARISNDNVAGPFLQILHDQTQNLAPLVDDIKRGSSELTQGATSNPIFPRLGKFSITTQAFDNRGVTGANSADTLSDVLSRNMSVASRNYIQENMQGVREIIKPGNEDSAFNLLLGISALRQGWDLETTVFDDLGRLKLNPDSVRNKAIVNSNNDLVRTKYNNKVPEFLPDIGVDSNIPLRFDELAQRSFKELNGVSDIDWSFRNTLARNLNTTGRQYKVGHVPIPRSYEDKIFVVDNTGRPVEYVVVDTPEKARREALKLQQEYNRRDKDEGRSGGYGIVDRNSVEEYKNLNHQVVTSDVLRSGTGDGAKAAGERSGIITDIKYLQNMFDETNAIFDDMRKQYTVTRFANELENVRSLQRIAAVNNRGLTNVFTGESGDSFTDVFSGFSNLLLGDNQRNVGSLYGAAGTIMDEAFANSWNEARNLWTKLVPERGGNKALNAAVKKYAENNNHNPIEYAANIAARSISKGSGLTSDKLVRQLAGLTTGLALKWGEVGHAALTTASILSTTPHAVRYAKAFANETAEDYATRVGHTHDFLDGSHAMPNPVKLTLSTIMKRMRGDYKDVLAKAAEKGYTDAKMAEFVDEFAVKRGGKIGDVLAKADKYTGYVSTQSEAWARETAFLTGYEMYRNIGKNSEDISMAMANVIANRAIADYRPHQRAELFKGTAGVPLAMFQTFAINYFQRLGSAIENKAYGAAFTQAGTQAMMFGGQSVPGFELFNEVLLENWNETRRPEDLFREGFGNENLGRMLLYGAPTTLPLMLGFDNGIALHNRGEMSLPRNITPATMFNTPFFSMASRTGEALKRGFNTAIGNFGEGGADALAESLIFSVPNRPLRGLLDVTLQGYSTNAHGDIVNDELDSIFEIGTHVTGLQTVRQAENAASLWRDRQRILSERASMDRLNAAVTARIRRNGLNTLTNTDIGEISEEYFSSGGSERGFKSWLKRTIAKAEISKVDREVLKAIRSTRNGRDLQHFLGIDDEE